LQLVVLPNNSKGFGAFKMFLKAFGGNFPMVAVFPLVAVLIVMNVFSEYFEL